MPGTTTFDEILDAIKPLSADQQVDLINVVRRRLAQRGRQQIIDDAEEVCAERAAGKTQAVSVDDLMREIES